MRSSFQRALAAARAGDFAPLVRLTKLPPSEQRAVQNFLTELHRRAARRVGRPRGRVASKVFDAEMRVIATVLCEREMLLRGRQRKHLRPCEVDDLIKRAIIAERKVSRIEVNENRVCDLLNQGRSRWRPIALTADSLIIVGKPEISAPRLAIRRADSN